jgi:hypothetical protein
MYAMSRYSSNVHGGVKRRGDLVDSGIAGRIAEQLDGGHGERAEVVATAR